MMNGIIWLPTLKMKKDERTDEFLCEVCNKQLGQQKIVALRKCGHAMCQSCCNQFVLSSTKLGRYVYAMGSNEMGARQVGINIRRYKLGVYVISGLSCALAALVLMGRMDSSSGKMAQMFELDAIAAVILGGTSLFGGRGSIWGSVLGAILITLIRNGMNLLEISQFKQMMAIGAVVIIAVWIDVLRRGQLNKR